jgi:hypothetical protein
MELVDKARDLAVRFSARAIPKSEWTHDAHVIVGAWHLQHYGASEALAQLRNGIRRLNEILSWVQARGQWVEPDLSPLRCHYSR